MPELPTDLTDPLVLRAVAGFAGLVLLLAGARLYQGAIRLSAFALGLIAVVLGLQAVSPWVEVAIRPEVLVAGGLVGGLAAVGMALLVHRVALIAVGAVAGLLAVASGGPVLGLPAWAPLVGSGIGALAFPFVFPRLLVVLTPLVGAVTIAWALERPQEGWIVGGAWLVGFVVQAGLVGGRRDGAEDRRASS